MFYSDWFAFDCCLIGLGCCFSCYCEQLLVGCFVMLMCLMFVVLRVWFVYCGCFRLRGLLCSWFGLGLLLGGCFECWL